MISEYYDCCETEFGLLYIHFKDTNLTALTFQQPKDVRFSSTSTSSALCDELREYFALKRKTFTAALSFEGATDFQKTVWTCVINVPYGETRTYKWLAQKIRRPCAYRAVGHALGLNPIPVIVPCHRVIRSNNTLGGYSGGIEVKKRLLELEIKGNKFF